MDHQTDEKLYDTESILESSISSSSMGRPLNSLCWEIIISVPQAREIKGETVHSREQSQWQRSMGKLNSVNFFWRLWNNQPNAKNSSKSILWIQAISPKICNHLLIFSSVTMVSGLAFIKALGFMNCKKYGSVPIEPIKIYHCNLLFLDAPTLSLKHAFLYAKLLELHFISWLDLTMLRTTT